MLTLMQMVVNGVSTRKVKRITRKLCGREFSRSTVSELAKGLDEQVEAWNERPLEGSYPFVLVDAMQIKVRRQAAVRPTSVLISALERCFQGVIWQRCQVHFRRNVVDRAPKSAHDELHSGLDRILGAEDPPAARRAFAALCEELEGRADAALKVLEAGLEDAITVLVLPKKYRQRLRTTNMLERPIEEVRRRERVIRIFPDERSPWRLLGALLAEQHELWITGRRWLAMDDYREWKKQQKTEGLERAA